MNNGFVDLRAANSVVSESDNFWPSFTDIMMVTVMIFMIASAVLILRNWELLAELRKSIESERMAAAAVQQTARQNLTLEEALAQAQYQVSELRMKLMRASEENQEKTDQLTSVSEQLFSKRLELKQLNEQLATTKQRLQSADKALSQSEAEYGKLKVDYDAQNLALADAKSQLSEVQGKYESQVAQMFTLQKQGNRTQQELETLKGEYDTIKVQYEKLIKPARTAKGKYVVEVQYEKRDGKRKIRFKAPTDTGYEEMTRAALEERLSQLKQRYPRRLYVKIVIPEDSGLSYNEAWNFTRRMLDQYDYYSQ